MSYVQIPHTADEKFKLFTYQLQKDWFSVPFPNPLFHKFLRLLQAPVKPIFCRSIYTLQSQKLNS